MRSSSRFDSNAPDWLRPDRIGTWDARRAIVPLAALAGIIGAGVYLLLPTDIERAEADLRKARAVVSALDDEAWARQQEARQHKTRAVELRKLLDEQKDTPDAEWVELHRGAADGHAQLSRANSARRDTLLHLTAEYLRLLAEAESEILRAKDARDRGTPYPVAPRVRDLLTPILAAR